MAGPLSVGSAVLKIVADWSGAKDQLDQFKKNAEKNVADLKKKVALGVSAAGAAIVGGFALAAKSAADFGAAMANVATLGVEDLKGLEAGLMDLARTYGVDLNDAAQALYDTISAGIPENAAVMVLEQAAKGAQAGVGSLNEALDLGTSVMNAYGLKSEDAATTTANFERIMGMTVTAVKNGKTTIADMAGSIGQLAPLASNAGVGVEELFAAVAALTGTGLGASESMTQLRAVVMGIMNPTAAAQKAAEELGIQFDAAALQSEGLEGVLRAVAEATGGNVEEIRKLFTSSEALSAVLSLTGQQADAFSSSLRDMSQAQANLNQMQQAWIEANPQQAWNVLKANLQVIAVQLGQAVIPAFNALLQAILPVLQALSAWAQRHQNITAAFAAVTLAVGALAMAVWPLTQAWKAFLALKLAWAVMGTSSAVTTLTGALGGLNMASLAAAGPWVALAAAVGLTVRQLWLAVEAIRGNQQAQRELTAAQERQKRELMNHAQILGEYTGRLNLAALEGLNVADAQTVMGAAIKAVVALKQNEAIPTEMKTQELYNQTAQAAIDAAAAEIRANQERITWWTHLRNIVADTWNWLKSIPAAAWNFMTGQNGAPGMATGGIVERGGMVQVHQDELLMLPSGAEVIPRAHTPAVAAAMGGGGGANVQVTINNPVVLDDNGLRKLRDELGRVTGYSITRAMSARGLA